MLTQFATYFGVKLRGCERQVGQDLYRIEGNCNAGFFGGSTFTVTRFKIRFLLPRARDFTLCLHITKVKCRPRIYSLENWLDVQKQIPS